MAASSHFLSSAGSPVEMTVRMVGVPRWGMAMSKGVEGQDVRVEMFLIWSIGWKSGERDTSREESVMGSGGEGVRGIQVVTWVRAKIVQMDTHEGGLVGRSIANDTQA